MISIQNLSAKIGDKEILQGLDLKVNAGEVHAIMGPNGSGKSTLSKVIAGHPDYTVTGGSIDYIINLKPKSLLELSPDERAREGVFLAYQYPVEIPGVSNFEFLRAAFNAVCRHQGVEEMDAFDFREFVASKIKLLGLPENFLDRGLNVDFSGGEKKRNEILQMAVLSPRFSVLDETDSGLDVDSLRIASEGINKLRHKHNAMVLITHYQRLLDYIKPDVVHVLYKGRIIRSGDASLAGEIETRGYDWVIQEAGMQ